MKKIAIIGAGDFQNPLILKAKQMGIETHVFAWKAGAVGEETADFFYPVSITERDEILCKCREIGIDAITTIGSDLATLTVNYVAEKLGLIGNSISCTEKATNKFLMRRAIEMGGIDTPKFALVDEFFDFESLDDFSYPLIVKPTDRSGSRAITKIFNKSEIDNAVKSAVENSFQKKAVIEEYIDGEEFSLEGISFNGVHKFLTITRKSTTGAPHFIETGHIQPSGIDGKQRDKIYTVAAKSLDALGVTNSATHSEFKITPEGKILIIEIGARMGGDCIGSDLVQISTGLDYLKMVIDVSLGSEPSFEKYSIPKTAIIRFIFNDGDLLKLKRVKNEYPEDIYFISNIDKINSHNVVDSSSRFGFYIISTDNKEKFWWLLNDNEKY